ncbi:hypothetical protein EC988_002104 [Linderina pennispora]|nr:hypothetical protein EC988_002104 [Linderina pennispora]
MVRAAGGALFNDFGKREEDLLEGPSVTELIQNGRRRSAGVSPEKSALIGQEMEVQSGRQALDSDSSSSSEPDDDEDEDWSLEGTERSRGPRLKPEESLVIASPSEPTTPAAPHHPLNKRRRALLMDESPSMATTPVAGHSAVQSSALFGPHATRPELIDAITERYKELGLPEKTRLVVVAANPAGLKDHWSDLSYAVVEPEAVIQSIIKCKVQFIK